MFDNSIFSDEKETQILEAILSQDQTNNEENVNSDLPMMPLSTILKSTHNFSDKYKLGEGGFGTVYKVLH